jgi:hypothetical protein
MLNAGEKMTAFERRSIPWARAVAISPSMDLKHTSPKAFNILQKDIRSEMEAAMPLINSHPLRDALLLYVVRQRIVTDVRVKYGLTQEEFFNALVDVSIGIRTPDVT